MTSPHEVLPTHRVFFALWPDDDIRAKIQQRLDCLPNVSEIHNGARRVPRVNWHITLAFVGAVTEATLDCLQAQAGQLQYPGFELVLNKVGGFRKPRVVWLGAAESPPLLTDLVATLNQNLAVCGYQAEDRPYQPHVTVYRKLSKCFDPAGFTAGTKIEPIRWPVRSFALIESQRHHQGSAYRMLGHWDLYGDLHGDLQS